MVGVLQSLLPELHGDDLSQMCTSTQRDALHQKVSKALEGHLPGRVLVWPLLGCPTCLLGPVLCREGGEEWACICKALSGPHLLTSAIFPAPPAQAGIRESPSDLEEKHCARSGHVLLGEPPCLGSAQG